MSSPRCSPRHHQRVARTRTPTVISSPVAATERKTESRHAQQPLRASASEAILKTQHDCSSFTVKIVNDASIGYRRQFVSRRWPSNTLRYLHFESFAATPASTSARRVLNLSLIQRKRYRYSTRPDLYQFTGRRLHCRVAGSPNMPFGSSALSATPCHLPQASYPAVSERNHSVTAAVLPSIQFIPRGKYPGKATSAHYRPPI